jgi:hypothetical protein
MDRDAVTAEQSYQVTVDEIITELNKQISSLNFELTVSKLAIGKLQNQLANLLAPGKETSKINSSDF